jgi:hypothetical protein
MRNKNKNIGVGEYHGLSIKKIAKHCVGLPVNTVDRFASKIF